MTYILYAMLIIIGDSTYVCTGNTTEGFDWLSENGEIVDYVILDAKIDNPNIGCISSRDQ